MKMNLKHLFSYPNLLLVGGIIFLYLLGGWGQNRTQQLRELQRQLDTIQQEINRLEREIRTENNKFKIENRTLHNIDQQISLIQQKINLYKREINLRENNVEKLHFQIDSLTNNINNLQELFANQVVFAYKYSRGQQFDWILGAENLNQALLRYRYFQKIASAERSLYDHLKSLTDTLSAKEAALQKEISEMNQLLALAQKENKNLRRKRETQKLIVQKISQHKTLLSKALQEKKRSYQRIAHLIATLEKEKPRRQLKPKTQIKWQKLTGNFSRNKGKLNWPVRGKILHPFGKFKNPKLKTVLVNSGIDIRAPRGSEVHCVFPGVVSLITYMMGFGNMIIIDHNDGYYTVYAHLDEIRVAPNDFVESGQVIGTVGESGSLEGPKLHFEIYSNNQPQNPVKWLKK